LQRCVSAWRGRMANDYAAMAARWRVPLGFALGVAYLVFCQPTVRLLVVGGTVAFGGLLLRAYAAGCLDKNQTLAVGGPYAYTRNPLYLGSALLGLGFAIAGGSWALAGLLMALFVLVYWPVMRREAEYLRQQFGDAYYRYSQRVPLFIPTGRHAPGAGTSFRWQLYRKNREYEAACGYLAAMAFLVLKMALR
jgi:protein-S-isoprenylcysteine O-methyltransferase Ste14